MAKVVTYDIPDYKIKLKIRQLQVMGKKIQGKLITQADWDFLVGAILSVVFFHFLILLLKRTIVLLSLK